MRAPGSAAPVASNTLPRIAPSTAVCARPRATLPTASTPSSVSQPIERSAAALDSAQTRRHTPDSPRTAGSAQKRLQENATQTETQALLQLSRPHFFLFASVQAQ